MANSNENPLNAHLLNPDSNPTYIYTFSDLFQILAIESRWLYLVKGFIKF